MLKSKITIAVVQAKFQDGRRRHFGNSRACYKRCSYHPVLMKIGTRTKKHMLSSKSQKRKCTPLFKMAAAVMFEIQVRAIKWAITTRF
jgi:hypothetical protein